MKHTCNLIPRRKLSHTVGRGIALQREAMLYLSVLSCWKCDILCHTKTTRLTLESFVWSCCENIGRRYEKITQEEYKLEMWFLRWEACRQKRPCIGDRMLLMLSHRTVSPELLCLSIPSFSLTHKLQSFPPHQRNKAETQGGGSGSSAVKSVSDSLRTGSHPRLGDGVAWSCLGQRVSPENLWRSLLSFHFSQIARACWMWSPLRTSRTTCCRPWSSSSSWTTQSPHSCSPRCSRRWQTSGRSSQSMCSYCMWSRRRRQTWAFTPCSRRSTRIYISRKVLPADVFLLSIALLFWGKKSDT